MKSPMRTHYGNHGDWALELPPAEFPYADSKTLAGAPARCPRCKDGIWKEVSDGLQCRQCPGHWLIVDKLRELVGRTLESEERWPVVRMVAKRKPG